MPFCPECHAEYRQGFDRCASCDVGLVEQLPEDMDLSDENVKRALEGKELIPITKGTLDVVKEIRVMLAGHRIASLILDDPDEQPVPGMPPRVLLVVGKDDFEPAVAALGDNFRDLVDQEGLESKQEVTYEKCPACGSEVSAQVEECPECGLFVGSG